jgi:hypothetical protein
MRRARTLEFKQLPFPGLNQRIKLVRCRHFFLTIRALRLTSATE